jgi:hypothetical protein
VNYVYFFLGVIFGLEAFVALVVLGFVVLAIFGCVVLAVLGCVVLFVEASK